MIRCAAFALLVALAGCRPAPVEGARDTFAADVEALDDAMVALAAALDEEPAPSDSAGYDRRVQAAFHAARRPFKRVEPLVATLMPGAHDLLNGAPIPEIEPEDPNAVVIAPEGFQTLEEKLFPAVTDAEGARLDVARMRAAVARVRATAPTAGWTDAVVFDAARLGLVRLVALGITGFDSAAARASMAEGAETVRGMAAVLAPYALAPDVRARLDGALAQAEAALEVPVSFDAFDRLGFVVDHAEPLARALAVARSSLGLPPPADAGAFLGSAASPFEAGAFSATAYAPPYAGAATPARAGLGRQLFHDARLSGDGRTSCATCHDPAQAFADGRAASRPGLRNTPTLLNAALQPSSSADLTTVYLEDRVSAVLLSPDEMHHSLDGAARAVYADPALADGLRRAFAATVAPEDAVRIALADYVRGLVRLDSRFDRYVRGDRRAMTAAEQRGFNLFAGKALCATCHFVPLFNGTVPPDFVASEAEILGVPARADTAGATVSPDLGRYATSRYDLHRHAFRTTTVRNSARTAPYFHNGAYATLDDVVDFYDRGGGAGIGIALEHQTLPADPLRLTERERADVVAFLGALSDAEPSARPPTRRTSAPQARR